MLTYKCYDKNQFNNLALEIKNNNHSINDFCLETIIYDVLSKLFSNDNYEKIIYYKKKSCFGTIVGIKKPFPNNRLIKIYTLHYDDNNIFNNEHYDDLNELLSNMTEVY